MRPDPLRPRGHSSWQRVAGFGVEPAALVSLPAAETVAAASSFAFVVVAVDGVVADAVAVDAVDAVAVVVAVAIEQKPFGLALYSPVAVSLRARSMHCCRS